MKIISQRLILAFIICSISAGLFVFMANSIAIESIEQFDSSIIGAVQALEATWLTIVFKVVTWIGSAYVVIPITLIAFLLLYFKYQRRGQAILFVTVIIATVSSNELLKNYFQRERPEIHRIIDAAGLSFPSGHTMMALSLYAVIAYTVWRNLKSLQHRILLILWVTLMILMIATSRIYLGVHYPSDIVGGLAASTFLVTFIIAIYEIFKHRKKHI